MAKTKKRSFEVCPRVKVWLETSEGYVLGEGRAELLRAVKRLGSLNRAAAEMGMSYRSAWGSVRTMEQRLGLPLLDSVRGGKDGGGATLTETAVKILKEYDRFEKSVHRHAQKLAPAITKTLSS